jgi:hypothetical protein
VHSKCVDVRMYVCVDIYLLENSFVCHCPVGGERCVGDGFIDVTGCTVSVCVCGCMC